MKKKIVLKILLLMGLCFLAPQVVNANTSCLQVLDASNGPTKTESHSKTIIIHKADGTILVETITITIYSDGSSVETKTTHIVYPTNTGLSR